MKIAVIGSRSIIGVDPGKYLSVIKYAEKKGKPCDVILVE